MEKINGVSYTNIAKFIGKPKADMRKFMGKTKPVTSVSPNGIVYDKSIAFDGVNDYLGNLVPATPGAAGGYPGTPSLADISPASRMLNTSNQWTHNIWFKFNSSSMGRQNIFSQYTHGSSFIKIYAQVDANYWHIYAWVTDSNRRYRYSLRSFYVNANSNRAFNLNSDTVVNNFHMLTVMKHGTANDWSDIRIYLNGTISPDRVSAGNASPWTSNIDTISNNQKFEIAKSGADFKLGEYQIWNRALTEVEVNQLLDGGENFSRLPQTTSRGQSYVEGTPDTSVYANMNAQGQTFSDDLIAHWYYDSSIDNSFPLLNDKVGNLDLRATNTSNFNVFTSLSTPNFSEFIIKDFSNAHEGDSESITVLSKNAGSVVTYYTDSTKTTTLGTGDSLTVSCGSVGSFSIHIEEVTTGGIVQTHTTNYSVVALCDSSYSINTGGINKIQLATDTNNMLPSFSDGSFTIAYWEKKDLAHNPNGGSWVEFLSTADNATKFQVVPYGHFWLTTWRIGNTYAHKYNFFPTPYPGYANEVWDHRSITYDFNSGQLTIYTNGEQTTQTTHQLPESSHESWLTQEFIFKMPRLGSYDDIAIYDGELTGNNISEIYNNGAPIDLSRLRSYSSIIDWFKMGEEDDPVNNNYLVSETSERQLSLQYIPNGHDRSTIKSTDRP